MHELCTSRQLIHCEKTLLPKILTASQVVLKNEINNDNHAHNNNNSKSNEASTNDFDDTINNASAVDASLNLVSLFNPKNHRNN